MAASQAVFINPAFAHIDASLPRSFVSLCLIPGGVHAAVSPHGRSRVLHEPGAFQNYPSFLRYSTNGWMVLNQLPAFFFPSCKSTFPSGIFFLQSNDFSLTYPVAQVSKIKSSQLLPTSVYFTFTLKFSLDIVNTH